MFAGDPATMHAGESSARVLEPTVGRYSGRLLAPGSIVAFDDIVEWEDVKRVFERVQSEAGWLDLGQDGRLGILQRTAELSSG